MTTFARALFGAPPPVVPAPVTGCGCHNPFTFGHEVCYLAADGRMSERSICKDCRCRECPCTCHKIPA